MGGFPSRRCRCLALAVFMAATATVLGAQAPSEPWRTLEVPGFRFHTPQQSEPWTREIAGRMAHIRRLVAEEVGFDPAADVVDVLVVDPVARANGTAWPILRKPRLVLYTTPPPAHGTLGHFHDWPEILAVHEAAHLAHLLRPSRNPWAARFEKVIPVGPLPRKVPNWVVEGYATLIEGRLTGWGRPNGDLRAALLRRWAQAGRLPSYGALSGDGERWLGTSFPYLVGSAYLEWLERRAGDGALRKLWARLTARRARTFDDAFRGVFEDSPARLYQRFCAETTYRAMDLEARRSSLLVEGELWQDLSWHTGSPAVSPDGEHLAVVVRRRGAPSTLVIWSTADDPEPLRRLEEARRDTQARDPQDEPGAVKLPLPRKPKFELATRHGAEPFHPRFAVDGESVLFLRYDTVPASGEDDVFAGATVPDIYRWWPEEDRVERVTEGAAISDFDPLPDGRRAVGVRSRFGVSELVHVDLERGAVLSLANRPGLETGVRTVWDHPRVSPDGRFMAYLRHESTAEGGGRQLRVHRLRDGLPVGQALRLPTPPGAGLAQPAWAPDSRSVIVAVSTDGFQDLWQYDLSLGGRRRITQAAGGASAPAPSPDGRLFFLALEDDGFDLRVLALRHDPEAVSTPSVVESWAPTPHDVDAMFPVLRPRPPAVPEILAEPVPPSTAYGAGPREELGLVGGSWTGHGSRIELGLRQGDPVGRLDLQLLGAVSDGDSDERGIGGAATWRRHVWDLGLRAFGTESPERSERHQGLLVTAASRRARRAVASTRQVGFLVHRGHVDGMDFERRAILVGGAAEGRGSWGPWSLEASLDGELQLGETVETSRRGVSWRKGSATLTAGVARRPAQGLSWRLGLQWRRGEVETRSSAEGSSVDLLRLGGTTGSVVPAAVLSRWDVPALPTDVLTGRRVETRRVDLSAGPWPVSIFAESHRAFTADGRHRLRLIGLDLSVSRHAMPLLRLPGFDADLGVARILDPPFEDEIEGWARLRWRP